MRSIRIYEDAAALAAAAAEELASTAGAAVRARGRFDVALSGGTTPQALYRVLAEGGTPPYRERSFWKETFVFIGDERSVPPDHPDSNFANAWKALLARVPLPYGHTIRFYAEGPDPDGAARYYERMVRDALGLGAGVMPRFDLVLLGLGPDGHTASLFPGTAALAVRDRIAVANPVARLATVRFTLTFPALDAARKVVFVVSGAEKAEVLARVLEGEPGADAPASLVRPADGDVLWLADRAAAAKLRGA